MGTCTCAEECKILTPVLEFQLIRTAEQDAAIVLHSQCAEEESLGSSKEPVYQDDFAKLRLLDLAEGRTSSEALD